MGTATVQQMAPMIVATCAALNLYNFNKPDPKNWTVTASYDYDFVDSGLSNRGLNRSRYGISATVVF